MDKKIKADIVSNIEDQILHLNELLHAIRNTDKQAEAPSMNGAMEDRCCHDHCCDESANSYTDHLNNISEALIHKQLFHILDGMVPTTPADAEPLFYAMIADDLVEMMLNSEISLSDAIAICVNICTTIENGRDVSIEKAAEYLFSGDENESYDCDCCKDSSND